MNEDFFKFNTVYIERKFTSYKNVENILSRIKGNFEIIIFDDPVSLVKSMPAIYDPLERSKSLVLTGIRGDILKRCPGSHGRLCCNYYVLNLYIGCPIGCTYCILQSYINRPFTVINVDLDHILTEVRKTVSENKNKIYRIGTGELGDSLVYDPLTGFSKQLIECFSELDNCIFEFKTKTGFIDNLLEFDDVKNIVAGFSVNPQIIADNEEIYSTPVNDRLAAARKLSEKKYRIAFHFDPIINIRNFKEQYETLIDDIFNNIEPDNIAWISLGTFRFTHDLKNMMEYNYPGSNILCDEFFRNSDGKYRYFMPIRTSLYKTLVSMLRNKSKNMPIYFCMESPEIWKNCLDVLPVEEKKMDLLYKNVILD